MRVRFTKQLPKSEDLMKSLISLSATLEGVNNPIVMLDGNEKLPLKVYLEGVGDNANRNDDNGSDNKRSKLSEVVSIEATLPSSKLMHTN